MACKCQDAANNTFTCIRRVSPDSNDIFCIFEDNQVMSIFLNMYGSILIFKNIFYILTEMFFIFFYLVQRFIEAYDMNVDEYQIKNIGYVMKKETRHRFRKRLKKMSMCRGAECVTNFSQKKN